MKFDRRRFLLGTGGAVLALPLLESLWPRRAQAQMMTPPKRFVFVTHPQGTLLERWRPAAAGALPASGSISQILAPLDRHRERIVVLSGVENPCRYSMHALSTDGHIQANKTVYTAAIPSGPGADAPAGGPSIDSVAGERLQGASERSSILLLHTSDTYDGAVANHHARVAGRVQVMSGLSDPRRTAERLFASLPTSGGGPPPTPTRRERLRQQRVSMLDGIASSATALRAQLAAGDRQVLDEHLVHLRTLEQRFNRPPRPATMACVRPDPATIPSFPPVAWNASFGAHDDVTTPAQIDNMVRALACDITRVAALQFAGNDPRTPWLYGGDPMRAVAGFNDWHDMVHNARRTTPAGTEPQLDRLERGFRFYSESFAYLLDRLLATPDLDGRPMLDSTLVLWMSEFGDGGLHLSTDIPVVVAGLGAAFAKGRHLDLRDQHPTNGDLFGTVLRLLDQPDMAFGSTGMLPTVCSAGYGCLADFEGFRAPVPLHRGPIAL